MKRFSVCVLVVFVVLLAGSVMAGNWWNMGWPYRKQLTVSTCYGENQSNFPVLLSLASDADLAAKAKADGSDIVIATGDGSQKLSREIEKFDNSTGQLVLWFKAPQLSTGSSTTFYLYYGKATANEANDTATWDDNYVMVQHLEEDPTSDTGYEAIDSTSNDSDGNTAGSMDSSDLIAGKIGDGWDFDGSDDYVNCGDRPVMDFDASTSATWSYWVTRYDNTGTSAYLNKCHSWAAADGWGFDYSIVADYPHIDGVTLYGPSGRPGSNVGQWVYVAHVRDISGGFSRTTYGSSIGSSYGTGGSLVNGDAVYIGRNYTSGRLNGKMDEVRVSNIARTTGWLRTCYENQKAPGSFVIAAAEEELPVSGTLMIVR